MQDSAARVPQEAPVEEWVEAWQAGYDREGNFRRLFDRFSFALFVFFRKRGFPPEHCEDLVQETFLGMHRGLGGFRREVPFETWLFELASNVYRKVLRRRSTQKRSGQEEPLDGWGLDRDEQPAGSPEAGEHRWAPRSWALQTPPTALRDMLGKERLQAVFRGLDELPPQMRRCAILGWYHGYSNHEIATLLKISPETVKVHQFKARKRLRQQLGILPAAPAACANRSDPTKGNP